MTLSRFLKSPRNCQELLRKLHTQSKIKNLPLQGISTIFSEALGTNNPREVLAWIKRASESKKSATKAYEFLVEALTSCDFDKTETVFLLNSPQYELELIHKALGLNSSSTEAFSVLEDWIGDNPDYPLINVVYPQEENLKRNEGVLTEESILPSPTSHYTSSSPSTSTLVAGGVASALFLYTIGSRLQRDE